MSEPITFTHEHPRGVTVTGTYVPEYELIQMRLRAETAEWNFKQACDTLRSIANADYRGNRSGESVTAHLFLESFGVRDG